MVTIHNQSSKTSATNDLCLVLWASQIILLNPQRQENTGKIKTMIGQGANIKKIMIAPTELPTHE